MLERWVLIFGTTCFMQLLFLDILPLRQTSFSLCTELQFVHQSSRLGGRHSETQDQNAAWWVFHAEFFSLCSLDCLHSFCVSLHSGPPCQMSVTPSEEFSIENGSEVSFEIEITDQAGNLTSQPRLTATCKVSLIKRPALSMLCQGGVGLMLLCCLSAVPGC